MPFFESTISKNYQPLVSNLKNKYDKIYNQDQSLKSSSSQFLFKDIPSIFSDSGSRPLSPTNSYNGSILSPRTAEQIKRKGILKNSHSRKVSWADQPHKNLASTPRPQVASTDRLRPAELSMPIEVVNTQAQAYPKVGSSLGNYKPAVLPSQKKTFKLGSTYINLNNSPDPEVVDQLGGITKTIDTMQDLLKSHELRPFDTCKGVKEPFLQRQFEQASVIESKISKSPDIASESASEFYGSALSQADLKSDNHSAKMMSASPFRAYMCVEK